MAEGGEPMEQDASAPFTHNHVVIISANEDVDIAQDLYDKLTAALFKVLFPHCDYMAGTPELKNHSDAIKYVKWKIFVISKHQSKDAILQYTHCMAEHRAVSNEQMDIIYLIKSGEEIPEYLEGKAMVYKQDSADYLEKVMKHIASNAPALSDLRPLGHVAPGLAYSFHYGYLKIILSEKALEVRIKECPEWIEDPNNRNISKKLFVFIPDSCNCPEDFVNVDSNITAIRTLRKLEKTRAGNRKRNYTNHLKCCTWNGKKVYFAGEFATPIYSMYEMWEEGFAGLTTHEKRQQVDIFYRCLTRILSHEKTRDIHDKVCIIKYPDPAEDGCWKENGKTMAELVYNRVMEEIINETS